MAVGGRGIGQGSVFASGPSLRELISQEARSRRTHTEFKRRSMREYSLLIPEANHGPLNLADFSYQIEPFYSDDIAEALEVVYSKSNQIGASTGLWRWIVRQTDQFGETTIYFFPTSAHVTEFGDERIEPSIDASEYLSRRMPRNHTRRKTMKKIGTGILNLRGLESRAGVQAVSAQAIVIDEYDDCFVAGTMVLTKQGHIPIEEVRIGDLVLTHRGRWRRVQAVGHHPTSQTLRVVGHGIVGLRGTLNHPYYARSRLPNRLPAAPRKISRGQSDRTCTVNGCDEYVSARDLCSAHYQRLRTHGDLMVDVPVRRMHERGKRYPSRERVFAEPTWVRADALNTGMMLGQVLPPQEENDRSPEWWWFIGRYLADGCSDGRSVHIDCAGAEATGLAQQLEPLFPNLRRRPYKNAEAVRFSISDRKLCERLEPYGRLAHGKHFTGEALSLDSERSKALLDGYLSGDGSFDAARGLWSAASVSRALSLGVALLVQKVFGVVPSCFECAPQKSPHVNGRVVKAKPQFRISFAATHRGPLIDGDYGWKPIKATSIEDGAEVWNLSVEEDESYIADNCIVHNCNADHISQAERRLTGAKAKGHKPRIRRSGRPTLPGYGIDAAFLESDQRRWHVECPECHQEQILEFHENMRWRSVAGGDKVLRAGRDDFEVRKDITEAWRACRSCDASLEGDPLREGVWKPTATGPGRVPGFHIGRIIVPLTDLEQIVVASRATRIHEIEAFYNGDLGMPYAAADAMLTDVDLDRAMAHGYEQAHQSYVGRFPVTLGVDVASERDLSARLTEHWPDGTRKALKIWEPPDFEDVVRHMNAFNVTLAAIDAQPERRSAKAVAAEFPGRVVMVEYEDNPRLPAWNYKSEENIVRVNRTEAIDAMMDGIRDGSNILLREEPPNYREQMKALKRRIEEDTKGRPRKVYVTTGQWGDDYAHAETYDLVAKEMLMQLQTAAEMEGEPVHLTPEQAPPRLGYGVTTYEPGFQDGGEY